jgi:hypothetical protein
MRIKYYHPSKPLVDYLQKELRSLEPIQQKVGAREEIKMHFKRDKETRNTIAKNKKDAIERISQSFIDVIYFLEFIEDHPELHDIYEKDLKDLFGINIDPDTRQSHYQNRGGAFSRFIAASLFNNLGLHQELDFRTQLIELLINHAIKGMRSRIEDLNEISLMDSDSHHFWLWGKILSSKAKNNKKNESNKRLGFYPYKYSIQKEK